MVTVESPQNCGNGACSAAEKFLRTCPQDCPVCMDTICGAGENNPQSGSYCPSDCKISVSIVPSQSSGLLVGDKIEVEFIDPKTNEVVERGLLEITLPSGQKVTKRAVYGSVEIQLTQSGVYVLVGTASRYSPGSLNLDVALPEEILSGDVDNISRRLEIINGILGAIVVILIILLLTRFLSPGKGV